MDDYTEPSTTPGSAIPETASYIVAGDEMIDPGDEMVGIKTIPSATVTSTATITAPTQTVLVPFTTVPAVPSSAPINGSDVAPAGGPAPDPKTTPIEGGGVESGAGANANASYIPASMEELTPDQQADVKDFTAAMCAEVTCDYTPSEQCPDAQDDPCIAVEDALNSRTFVEAYEEAKRQVAAEEEERKKEAGNDGKDGDDGNDDDDDDDDDLGLKVGLPVSLGVPAAGAIGASAYGKLAGKAWWPPSLLKPKAKGDGALAPIPEPAPEPAPGPAPGPGTPPPPGTPVPPVGPPPNVEPPINYTPVNNVDGQNDKDPEQEEEGAWKQSPSSPHHMLPQRLPKRGSGVDSPPSSLPAPGFSPFRRSIPLSLRPLFADHRRRAGLADCRGELMRKNQELASLKHKLDELEKYNPQEGASDYKKVEKALREWQKQAQDAILEQDVIKQDLKRCQDAVDKLEFDEPESDDGKGKEQEAKCEAQETKKIEDLEQKVKQVEDLQRKVKQIEELEKKAKQAEDKVKQAEDKVKQTEEKVKQTEDLERTVKSLESAYQGAQQTADKLRARESQVTQDLTKCSVQKEKCKRDKKKCSKKCRWLCF